MLNILAPSKIGLLNSVDLYMILH